MGKVSLVLVFVIPVLPMHSKMQALLRIESSRRRQRNGNGRTDFFESYIVRGYDVHTVFLFDILIPLWDEAGISPYPCGERIATIFPDGTIGPCIRNHSFKTGTIFEPDPLGKLRCGVFQHGLNAPGLPDECKTCESRNTCQGGCPNEKRVLTGATGGKAVLCELHKRIIPRLRHLDKLKKTHNNPAM